jgi:amino acid transporter
MMGNQTVSMYAAFHADFVVEKWHVLVGYLICTWVSCATVLFANRLLPILETLGIFFIVAGVLVTIIVCATMPHVNGTPYTSSASVWRGWDNQTGYSNDFFVFLAGMVNGAFAMGTPHCVTHLAEEIPRPGKNLPKAIGVQMVLGFFTTIFYLLAILYGTTDLSAAGANGTFPLAEIYRQATGSRGGSLGLLIVAFIPTLLTAVGGYIIAGRLFWTLARDNATPFSPFFARVSPRFHNPFNATMLCGVTCTLMGCMYVGSSTAFNAFVGSYVQLSTLSYLMAILPHLLSGRGNIIPGWFWMRGPTGFAVNLISCLYIVVFLVIFCFPSSLPATASSMNYASLITGGLSLFVGLWWFLRQANYLGPRFVPRAAKNLAKDAL